MCLFDCWPTAIHLHVNRVHTVRFGRMIHDSDLWHRNTSLCIIYFFDCVKSVWRSVYLAFFSSYHRIVLISTTTWLGNKKTLLLRSNVQFRLSRYLQILVFLFESVWTLKFSKSLRDTSKWHRQAPTECNRIHGVGSWLSRSMKNEQFFLSNYVQSCCWLCLPSTPLLIVYIHRTKYVFSIATNNEKKNR